MYQGNHDSRDKRNSSRESGTPRRFRWRKEFVLLVSVFAMITGVVGGTVAYLVADTDPLTNNFDLAEVSCEVKEVFENNIKTNVKIKNTSDIPAYIRAKVVVTWQDENGNVYGKAPQDSDYTIEYNDVGWTKANGYWYCDQIIEPSTKNDPKYTPVLINSCSSSGNDPEGYHLSVEILAEAIQSQPTKAITQAWGYTPSK